MSTKFEKNESSRQPFQYVILALITAGVLRYYLMISKYQVLIANHVEVSTPLNSWKRVSEGLYLLSNNINPYNGDLLHETPLSLLFYSNMLKIFRNEVRAMMLTIDIVTGLILYCVSNKYILELWDGEKKQKPTYAKGIEDALLKPQEISRSPFFVLLAYLFNPFTVLSCVGYSTTVFQSFYLSLMLAALVYGLPMFCGMVLALCSSVTLYLATLIVPISLYFKYIHKSMLKVIMCAVSFVVCNVLIVIVSSKFGQDYGYLKNVYGCILTVPDLQPNIGLFWYFFTEMFDHFRELFIYAFQINATVLYLTPLSIKFRKQPFLLTVAIIFLITIFKSYPSIGDVGFSLSLLPCFIHLYSYTQQSFLVGVILLISSSLAPVLWHLWIYCNSANANFYFGVTLAFAIGQIFLLTDLLFAQVKRDFILKNGNERKIKGEEASVCLE